MTDPAPQKKTDPDNSSFKEKNLILSLAAMFDAEFSIDWLEELTGLKASLILSVLEEEVQQQVLTRKRPAIYLFRNPQKRLEWLAQLPQSQSERYRRSIAAILVRELPDDDAKALEVARHLLHFSNDWKGCQWLVRAGEIHVRSFATEKAVECFARVLNDLSGQKGENEDRLFVKAAIEYANMTAARGDTLATLSILREARARAKRRGERSCEILLEMHIAKYEWLHSQFDRALQTFDRALSMAQGLADPDLMAATTNFRTYFLFWQGRFRDVIQIYEKSVPDVERYPIGHFPLIAAITVGRSYTMIGQLTQGLGMLDAIRNYCLERGNLHQAADAGSAISMTMLPMNRVDDALRYLKSSLKEATESGNYWVTLVVTFMLALAHYRKGNKKQSIAYLHRFLKSSREARVTLQFNPYLMEICWAMETGDLPRIPGLSLEQEIPRMLRVGNIFIKGIAYRYRAFLGKLKGWSNQRVTKSLTLSVKFLQDSGAVIELAKTQLELGRHYLSIGNDRNAKKTMLAASQILSSINIGLIPDDLKPLMANQNPEKAALYEILELGTEMAANQDNRKLLQLIVTTVNRITGAERGALLLFDQGTKPLNLQLRASKNLTIEQVYHPGFGSSMKMIEEVAASGVGRIFEIEPVDDPNSFSKEIIRSSICVPVILNEEIIGVLYHDNRLLRSVFKESDLKLLSYFAALAALELDNSRAHQEIQGFREKRKISRERDDLPIRGFEGIIRASPAIQHVLAQVDQVAKTDTAVLILGETGVGKGLLAETIHRQSSRSSGPFISVHCSALTESLITSELFGHEKGSFTGATNRQIGRFELANGGTLFLDEIADLSREVQARLLRVLQSKEFERVGGGKETLTSDFRLIAATNRNLEQEVKANGFREDLYYRINVFPIYIPPLRERRDDIPLLAHHFLQLYASRHKKPLDNIPDDLMEQLIRYDWPGNIRELENIIQRSVILSREPHFQLSTLEMSHLSMTQPNRFSSLKENERQHILEALRRSEGKIHGPGGAAETLEINPSTLTSRMKKLGIAKHPRSAAKESKSLL